MSHFLSSSLRAKLEAIPGTTGTYHPTRTGSFFVTKDRDGNYHVGHLRLSSPARYERFETTRGMHAHAVARTLAEIENNA